jgi:hypothetical protein
MSWDEECQEYRKLLSRFQTLGQGLHLTNQEHHPEPDTYLREIQLPIDRLAASQRDNDISQCFIYCQTATLEWAAI